VVPFPAERQVTGFVGNGERQIFCLFISDKGFLARGSSAVAAVNIEAKKLFF
jgi:hypothetical protein